MRPRTVNRLAVALIVLVVGAFGFLGRAVAKADVQSYLDALHSEGFYHEDGDGMLVSIGMDICEYLGDGWPPMAVAREVYRNTPAEIDPGDAGYIVGAAIGGLCPQYAGMIS